MSRFFDSEQVRESLLELEELQQSIFDELFSGTNPEEAVAAATAMLHYLKETPICFLMTTHFKEICNKANVTTKQMVQYQLKNGISSQKGGIQVLENMNFPSSFLKDAKDLCA
jgi:DNA mismatch repair ATPase MutS